MRLQDHRYLDACREASKRHICATPQHRELFLSNLRKHIEAARADITYFSNRDPSTRPSEVIPVSLQSRILQECYRRLETPIVEYQHPRIFHVKEQEQYGGSLLHLHEWAHRTALDPGAIECAEPSSSRHHIRNET